MKKIYITIAAFTAILSFILGTQVAKTAIAIKIDIIYKLICFTVLVLVALLFKKKFDELLDYKEDNPVSTIGIVSAGAFLCGLVVRLCKVSYVPIVIFGTVIIAACVLYLLIRAHSKSEAKAVNDSLYNDAFGMAGYYDLQLMY